MRDYNIITLVAVQGTLNADNVLVETDSTQRTVFCEVKSVGYREFFAAEQAGETADAIAIIYAAEYNDEPVVIMRGVRYRVLKSYKVGTKLELTLSALRERNVI